MRRPNFRLRTLMLAVGVVALLLWGGMMGLRSFIYYRLATTYGMQERFWREHAIRDRGNPKSKKSVAAVWGTDVADYYAPLVRKYRRAMWRPWDPVAPDPPAPVFSDPRR